MGKGTLELNKVIGALLSHAKMKKDGDESQAYGLVVKSNSNNHNRSKLRGRTPIGKDTKNISAKS